MARENNFWTMRVLPGDRELIAALARREGVPAAEAVRIAVRRTLQETDHAPAKAEGVLASPRP